MVPEEKLFWCSSSGCRKKLALMHIEIEEFNKKKFQISLDSTNKCGCLDSFDMKIFYI